jgi:heavy metal sensor kinase
MKWIRSIRARFALWATALILVFLAAFGGFVYINLSVSLHTAIDDTLSFGAAQTAASLNVENGQILILEPITLDESGSEAFTESGLTLVVLSNDGSILQAAGPYRSYPAPVANAGNQSVFLTLPGSGERDSIRIYILPVLDNNQVVGWVQAMQSLGNVDDSLQRLLVTLFLGGGMLSLLAGFAGYFLAARTLAPIDNITHTARRISTADLSARLNLPDTGDEVSRLSATFDEMLGRLETGFKRERQFTADASHELRTPLAALQAILSVTRARERSTQEYQQALEDLSDETDRMRGLVEDLLSLARGENGFSLHLEPLDLALLLSDVSESLRPLAGSRGLEFTCDLPPALPFSGDMDALIRLFVNLLDNAIKYTERGSVSLSARQEENTIIVKVSDTGIGIPAEHLAHIFERFYRVETARSSGGVGLGLAIARQIAQAHGGNIEVESSPNAGTTFTVKLPLMKQSIV